MDGVPWRLAACGLAVAAAAVAPAAGQATPSPAATNALRIESLTTPDGSRFLLVPRAGRPVVHWASFTAIGRVHEARGQEGLARACAVASLNGTRVHGTVSAELEEAALLELDRLLAERDQASRPGAAPARSGLEAQIVEAQIRARSFGDRLQWRRLLAALPARQPRVEVLLEGTLLTTAVSSARLRDLAQLLESRQRDAVLRGFHEAMAQARQELQSETGGLSRPRREALRLAIDSHPIRNALNPPPSTFRHLPRRDALDFWRRHARPDRTLHVLVGDIDPARAGELLRSIFAQKADPTLMPPEMPEELGVAEERETRLTGGEPRVVCAWRLPEGTSLAELEVVALLLAGGTGSELVAPLLAERSLARSIEVVASFPCQARPALLLVDALAKRPEDYPALEMELLSRLERLRRDGTSAEAIARARQAYESQRARTIDTPMGIAADLARRAAMGFGADLEAPPVEAIAALLPRLLATPATTRVLWQPAPAEAKDPEAKEKQRP